MLLLQRLCFLSLNWKKKKNEYDIFYIVNKSGYTPSPLASDVLCAERTWSKASAMYRICKYNPAQLRAVE